MPNFKVNSVGVDYRRYNIVSTSKLKSHKKPTKVSSKVPPKVLSTVPPKVPLNVPTKTQIVHDGTKWVLETADQTVAIGTTCGKAGKYGVYAGFDAGKLDTSDENTYYGCRVGMVKSGGLNTCIGNEAGMYNTGRQNTYLGNNTCSSTGSSGSYNTCIGSEAGFRNTSGNGNLFAGVVAGASNTEGNWNVFLGQSAGNSNETGSGNVFLGSNSGISNISGNGCICIGDGADVSSEDAKDQIVIGSNTIAYGNNTITFPDNLISFPNGTEVNFSSTNGGCLYPVSSSRRWKDDIQPIENNIDTSKLYELEPVTYKSKTGENKHLHLGLIAEEVDKYFPELVPKDREGLPSSVRYSLLTVLLLAEIKKLKAMVEKSNTQ